MINKFTENNLKILTGTLPVTRVHLYNKGISLTLVTQDLSRVLKTLKWHTTFQYQTLSCVSGLDLVGEKARFKITYELLSLIHNNRIQVATFTSELKPIESVTAIFPSAGWYESEIWDMLGIFFRGNEGLTRLLTDYGFEGYPLRKDFPLSGFVEARYDFTKRQVLNSKIELSQKPTDFTFDSPWDTLL